MIYLASEIVKQQINLAQVQDSDAISWERMVQLLNAAYEHLYYESIQSTSDDLGHNEMFFTPDNHDAFDMPYNCAKIKGVYKISNDNRIKLERDRDYRIEGNRIKFLTNGLIRVDWNTTAPVLTYPREPLSGVERVSKDGVYANNTFTDWNGSQTQTVGQPIKYYLIGRSLVYTDADNNLRLNGAIIETGVDDLWKIDAYRCGFSYNGTFEAIEEDGSLSPIPEGKYAYFLGGKYRAKDGLLEEYRDEWTDITMEIFPAETTVNDIISGDKFSAIETNRGIFIWDFQNAEPLFDKSLKTLIDYTDNDNGYGLVARDRAGEFVMTGCYLDTLINWPIGVYSEWMIAELQKQVLIQSRQQDDNIDKLQQDYWERCMFQMHRDIGSPKKLRNRWTERRI